MSTVDKAHNKVEDTKGIAKETVGRATGDQDLEREGKIDQASAAVKNVGEKVKDAGEKAKDLLKR